MPYNLSESNMMVLLILVATVTSLTMGHYKQRWREKTKAAAASQKLNGFFTPKRKCTDNIPSETAVSSSEHESYMTKP